jgi:dTDP-4-amino-4,6-dideoxygalactose transaminase
MKKIESIPFFSFSKRLETRGSEYSVAFNRVLRSGKTISGNELAEFEHEFARFSGSNFCIGVGNGTDGLEIALASLGLPEDSLVGTVANAGGYTSIALLKSRLRPIYMDVEIGTRNVTLANVIEAVSLGARAIVLTHLYGRVIPEIYEITEFCKKRGIPVIEDCSQAHGASSNGKHVGTFGTLGIFSFYPTKNLGALGDAGAIVCMDQAIAETARALRTYGWGNKYEIEYDQGRNSRLDEIQAAFLRINLGYLEEDNSKRQQIASRYLASIDAKYLELDYADNQNHVFHLFTLRSTDRKRVLSHLQKCDVGVDVHFPIPDHKQKFSKYFDLSLPNTEQLAREIFSIPCYPELTPDQQERVISALNSI